MPILLTFVLTSGWMWFCRPPIYPDTPLATVSVKPSGDPSTPPPCGPGSVLIMRLRRLPLLSVELLHEARTSPLELVKFAFAILR